MSVPVAGRRLVRSGFLHLLPLDNGTTLAVHAISQRRLVLRPEVAALVGEFAEPREVGEWVGPYCASHGLAESTVLAAVEGLADGRLLVEGSAEQERRETLALASQLFGRDPEAARRGARRWASQQLPRFAAPIARSLEGMGASGRRLDVILVGLCDVQIELDILREQGRALGIDLRPQPILESTLDAIADTPHEAIIVGALGARHGHWHPGDGGGDLWPERYLAASADLVARIRERSQAPILLHNLPVPTCSPLGFADRGPHALASRARRINDGLERLASERRAVYVVDVDGALAFEGKRRLLDDRLMTFSHLGGLGWWTALPDVELGTVFGRKPPVERLAELGVGEPFEYDRAVAALHLAMLAALFGIGRRRAVVVGLDQTLWPGLPGRDPSPFPRGVDFGIWSYHSLWVGIHEALKALAERGIRLAGLAPCAEDAFAPWWRYPARAPLDRLLVREDFEAVSPTCGDAARSLTSVCASLGVDPAEVVYVEVDEGSRRQVEAEVPDALVLGGNPFAIRGALLTDPGLQRIEAADDPVEHPAMMVSLARREKARRAAADETAFLASLGVRCAIARGVEPEELERVHELVTRTSQFTTTARRFARAELATMGRDASRGLYTLKVEDRIADYGLVGVAVSIHDAIELFLLSCRVVGLGVDQVFLSVVAADLLATYPSIAGRVLERPKNLAARSVFSRGGFVQAGDGLWRLTREQAASCPPPPGGYVVVASGLDLPARLRTGGTGAETGDATVQRGGRPDDGS